MLHDNELHDIEFIDTVKYKKTYFLSLPSSNDVNGCVRKHAKAQNIAIENDEFRKLKRVNLACNYISNAMNRQWCVIRHMYVHLLVHLFKMTHLKASRKYTIAAPRRTTTTQVHERSDWQHTATHNHICVLKVSDICIHMGSLPST